MTEQLPISVQKNFKIIKPNSFLSRLLLCITNRTLKKGGNRNEKTIRIILAFVLTFSIVACGGRPVKSPASDAGAAAPQSETVSPQSSTPLQPDSSSEAQADVVLKRMRENTYSYTYITTTGYEIKVTFNVSPWVRASDAATLQEIWKGIGGNAQFPSIDKFGEATDGFTEQRAAMYFLTLSFQNVTPGFNITSQEPVKALATVFDGGGNSYFGKSMVQYANATIYAVDYISVDMTSNRTGNVLMVIVKSNVFTPDHPNGNDTVLSSIRAVSSVGIAKPKFGDLEYASAKYIVDILDSSASDDPQEALDYESPAGTQTPEPSNTEQDISNRLVIAIGPTKDDPIFADFIMGTGFFFELCDAIADQMRSYDYQIIEAKLAEITFGLSHGTMDAAIGLTATEKLGLAFDYTLPYLEFNGDSYIIAVAKDNTALLNSLNDALQTLKNSGKLDEMIHTWFGDTATSGG